LQQPVEKSPADASLLGPVPSGAEALVLAQLLEQHALLLHVAVNDRALETLAETLPFFAPTAEILRFPAWDCLPYDRISPRGALMAERLRTLATLIARNSATPLMILTTANAFMQKLPPREAVEGGTRHITAGQTINLESLTHFLNENGYRRSARALEAGEYAARGGIVDVIPAGSTQGVRLDFFGDTLESLRSFDPLTQRSESALPNLTLSPASEVMLSEARIAHFRSRYREEFGAVSKEDPLYEAISSGQQFPGMEHWLPLFYERLALLNDYAPGARITFDAEAKKTISERQETARDYFAARRDALKIKDGAPYHPVPPELHYVMEQDMETLLAAQHCMEFSPFAAPSHALPLRAGPNLAALRHNPAADPFAQLQEHIASKRAEGKATLLACSSSGSAQRINTLMTNHALHVVRAENMREAETLKGKTISIAVLPLAHGFETPQLAIVTEQDLFGENAMRTRAPRKKASEAFLAEAANFTPGELVVHREHGIGRFEGLETLSVQDARHDCLKLIYDGGDKLYLPVENIELLTRYGSETEGASLDKLGAASWQARKARMKERIHLAAEALLKVAAERLVAPGPVLSPSTAYEAFCDRFPYMETEDQQRAIDDVLADLERGRPMDRLVCGDVGFGKTEVALRAAFAAVTGTPVTGTFPVTSNQNSSHQVAIIAPTTLLVRQHYRNFKTRFEGFGIEVRQLSRMVPARKQVETRQLLAEGKVDIVIGTHALLAKSVTFKHLGLVVVDEEQHFGVGQKEKLKELKTGVHVLTLSATPIPRTLQMALTGVRDLSLITTPPIDRLAVRSFVMPWDSVVLREAIMRERHRSGRVFFVTPRVADIGDLKVKLHELVPELRIASAHGQMPAAALDEIMNDFYDGKYDVLLSTAIVESGLDIPQANTIIIHRADRFGLAQLYQLRGRVGRAKTRAYAYFLLPHGRELTREATRRLEVMQSLDTLGAGFQLASHDMDIRGFGNLVGEEQSGHIREVGIELYQQMLEEAVAALKNVNREPWAVKSTHDPRSTVHDWSPTINLGLSVLIPEDYVADLELRMGLYRRAGALETADDIAAFADELTDRFGPPPPEVQHLLAIVRLKQLCKQAAIDRLDAGPKGAVLTFREAALTDPQKLLAYIAKHPTRLKLRPDQKVVAMAEWRDEAEKVAGVTKLLQALAEL